MFIKSSIFHTILSPRTLFHTTKGLPVHHKIIIVLLLIIIVGAFLWWFVSIYNFLTITQPTYGGQYTEAFVGQPRYINPLLSHSSSADRSLTNLIFDGLFDYDANGLLRPDLADRFEISDDGKEYTVFLRDDIYWHDDEPVTTDDVIFTIDIARDIAYGAAGVSNELRLAWHDVQTEKIDNHTVKFILKDPNSAFLHSLTIGLLPKHIWENIGPEQFQLAEYNQKPIGTGPYEFVDLDIDMENNVISSYTLRSYENYHRGQPYITKFVINFYPTRAEAVNAYEDGEVTGVIVDKRAYIDTLSAVAQKKSIEFPHYFAVFFNQTKSVPLAFDEVREALSLATDREAIISEVFGENEASVRYSPFAEGVVGFAGDVQQPSFDGDKANALLDDKGWKRDDDGIRKKDDARLSFTIHVSADHEELMHVAQLLQEQWKKVGADVQIQEHEKNDLETNVIKPRDYDALLYAHQMRFEPNLLPLWDGKEKNDPGLNYALFDDEKMNAALEDLLKTHNAEEQNNYYKTQQERLKAETPAIFLFAPKLFFMHGESIKGINVNRINTSYGRYVDVNSWYIKQKRVKK